LHIAIEGLPKEYNAFRLAIRTRSTTLSFDELGTMHGTEEESWNDSFEINETFAMAINTTRPPSNFGYSQQSYGNRGRGGRGNSGNRGRVRDSSNPSGQS